MTPSRAFFTRGVSVLILWPGATGIAQEATGLGLFSTWQEIGRAVKIWSCLLRRVHAVRGEEACRMP